MQFMNNIYILQILYLRIRKNYINIMYLVLQFGKKILFLFLCICTFSTVTQSCVKAQPYLKKGLKRIEKNQTVSIRFLNPFKSVLIHYKSVSIHNIYIFSTYLDWNWLKRIFHKIFPIRFLNILGPFQYVSIFFFNEGNDHMGYYIYIYEEVAYCLNPSSRLWF